MQVWVKEGTAPKHAVMAEMPRGPDIGDECAPYLRQLVGEMLVHKRLTTFSKVDAKKSGQAIA